jgi:DNA-binding transcriptional ArsR family regulator
MAIEEHDQEPHRVVTDADTMRALAHPVRIALLEALALEGELTATAAGDLIGESSTTCSFHLRQLAKYGFVEEAGGGKGRARPWKRSFRGFRFSSEHADDPAAEIAAGTLARLFRERQFQRLQTWMETSRSYPEEWRSASSMSEFVVWMTPQELEEFNETLFAQIERMHRDRAEHPSKRPEGALPVEYLLYSYPMRPVTGDQS